jgi:hypothetical protein
MSDQEKVIIAALLSRLESLSRDIRRFQDFLFRVLVSLFVPMLILTGMAIINPNYYIFGAALPILGSAALGLLIHLLYFIRGIEMYCAYIENRINYILGSNELDYQRVFVPKFFGSAWKVHPDAWFLLIVVIISLAPQAFFSPLINSDFLEALNSLLNWQYWTLAYSLGQFLLISIPVYLLVLYWLKAPIISKEIIGEIEKEKAQPALLALHKFLLQ